MDGPLDLPHLDKGPRNALPIVLVHGFPLDHRMWAPQTHALEAAGHRVIVPDLRGLGKAPLGKSATMQEHAADIIRMLDRTGVRRFALAGFSMGGYVALELAREVPDRLAGLALVDTRAEPDSEEGKKGRAAMAERLRNDGTTEVLVGGMFPKMLTPTAPAALQKEVRDAFLAQDSEGCAQCALGMAARGDARAWLPSLKVPTLVVVGEQDTLTPPDAAREMAALVPDAKLLVIAGAAHLTTLEKPDEVNAALLSWAAQLR